MKNVEGMTIAEKEQFVRDFVSQRLNSLFMPNPKEVAKLFKEQVTEALDRYVKRGVLDNFEVEITKDGVVAHVQWSPPPGFTITFSLENG